MEGKDIQILGNHLQGKDIALLITGGIAAYKTPSLVRHFRQYGANVHVYLTPEAKDYVTTMSLEWTSTNPVVSELTADVEHLREFDAYVIAPATYNTIGKFANGVADNAVTTTLASAIGRLENKEASILIAPAMHGTMYNSTCKENLEKLVSKGAKLIEPDNRFGKANLADTHTVVVETIRELSESNLKGKNILVTAGPTPVKIDNVRIITNRFSGRLGVAIADEAYMRGADVDLILGKSSITPPKYLDTIKVRTFDEYIEKVLGSLSCYPVDVAIFSAAVADYQPTEVKEGKIPSGGAWNQLL